MFDMQIEVVGKSAGVATQLQGTIVELTEVSIVKLSLHPRDVSSTSQIGKDLVVKLVNGESITIKNFFITEGDDKSELVLEDDEGALWYAQYDYPLTEMVFVEASDSVVLGWAEWGLGALALLGLAVGASGGGSSSKGNFSVDKTPPDAPTDLEINNNEDGSTTVTGKGEPGAEIIITDKDGEEVGRGEVGEDG
ncbi:BapA/Bap/LapF family prefix-like domain-containing protein, partial [Thiopseudomonas alkaliphila]|uniref:BapA/Bap/LapF family prefix-like domain-containing protein n=1 Tax=Thiopseudomonas alkaliphila TaxID=1697053 RepID=UPI00257755A1